MATTLPSPRSARHLSRLETVQPQMAKAVLNEIEVWKKALGSVVARTFELAGLTQKEGAALVDRDVAQVARWISGAERPQFDALFAVDRLRHHVVVALAELAGHGVEDKTTIEIRRVG